MPRECEEDAQDPERILLLGRQGSGKGLVGRLVAKRRGAQFISMGDVLRAEQRRDTDLGRRIGDRIDAGHGVPPDISYELLTAALPAARESVVVDGIPRRADELGRVHKALGGEPSKVVVLDVPTPMAVERLLSRRSCSDCGMPHGPGWPPLDDRCRSCGARVLPRPDDGDLTRLHRRLDVWGFESRAIVGHYARKGLVSEVAADAPVLDVVDRVMRMLTPRWGQS